MFLSSVLTNSSFKNRARESSFRSELEEDSPHTTRYENLSLNNMEDVSDVQRVTCTACQVEIIGSEQRRAHYHSDLHLVNLKRKVGGLGPLTEPEFRSRLAILQQNKRLLDEKERGGREKTVCDVCHKVFSSHKAYLNHEKSRRHVDTLHRQDAHMSELSSDAGPVASDETWEPRDGDGGGGDNSIGQNGDTKDWAWDDDNEDVDAELERRAGEWREEGSDRRSAFDDCELKSPEAALDYMRSHFNFFVPYAEYLSDAGGLVRYLSQKVCIGYACVACDRGFGSAEDARRHMRDVSHCRVTSDNEAFIDEYDEFYDWNQANGKEDTTSDKGATLNSDGWVVVQGEDEDLENAVVVSDNRDTHTSPAHFSGLADDLQTDTNGEAYALSVGDKLVGHRSLARYYKQPASRENDTRDAVVANRQATQMRVAAWKSERRRITQAQAAGQGLACQRRQCFELSVGQSNYYVRKSKLRQNMSVLNSGYRA